MKKQLPYLGYVMALLLFVLAISYSTYQNHKLKSLQNELALYKELEYTCSQQLICNEKKLQASQVVLHEYQQLFPETFMKAMNIDDSRIKEYTAIAEE